MQLDAEQAVRHALDAVTRAGAHAADAVVVEADSLDVRVRGDEIDFVTQARERTLGIRAFVKGAAGLRCAVTSTSDLSADAVGRMASETVALARATAEDPAAGLPEAGFAADAPDLGLYVARDRSVGVDSRTEVARTAEAAARAVDPRIVNSEGSEASSSFHRVAIGNTSGFFGSYESARHSVMSQPIAAENGAMQTDYWYSVARSLAAEADPAEVGRIAARRALRRLGARRAPTCQVPVVFDPPTARALLGNLAACLTGSSVYRESSFLAGRLGERIASEQVTVIDDGRLPGGLGSRPFDGEGLPTRRTPLVTRGRLESYLLDSYSARKLGLRSTGNASRSAGSAPGVSATNLWLEPGSASPEAIVASTPRGLLVTGLFGHGFNPVTGDFSRGATGVWIEDGALAHAVEEITVAGNLRDMLAAIDAVGSDLQWLGPIAAPTLRVASMTVAGA
jgi:PmbA protein